jgi:hypothetical protein
VRLDELIGGDGRSQDLGELIYTGLLGLSRTVGEEDVRNLDTELVVAIEDLKDTFALRNKSITMDQDTVNVEDECHIFGRSNLLMGEILDLSGDDVT